MFPLNPSEDTHEVRNREKYKVNKSHTEAYKKSTIPTLQRKLNEHFLQSQEQSPKTWQAIFMRAGVNGNINANDNMYM